MKTQKSNSDWNKKCQYTFMSTFGGNENIQYGIANEDVAVEVFSRNYRCRKIISNLGLCVKPDDPKFAFSPDAIMLGVTPMAVITTMALIHF